MREELKTYNILKLAWPTIISQATIIAVGAIDLFFIGQLGTISIAAVALANSFMTTLYQFLEGIRTGSTILIAQYSGSDEPKSITNTINHGLFAAIVIGIIIALFASPISKLVYKLAHNTDLIKVGGPLHIFFRILAVPFVLIFFAIDGFFRGLKNTFSPLLITLAACIINAILDYGFIWGAWGLPKMFVPGAACATLIAYVSASIFAFIFLFKSKYTKPYAKLSLRGKKTDKVFTKIAIEIGLFFGIINTAMLIFAYMFSRLGVSALAAHNIGYLIFSFSYLVPTSFLIAASIFVGQLIGSQKTELIDYTVKKIIILSISFVTFLNLILFISAPAIARFFSPTDLLVTKLATKAIRIVNIEQFFCAIFLVIRGALTGIRDTKFITINSLVVTMLIFVPSAYILGIKLNYGIVGGYYAILIWSIADTITYTGRYLFIRRRFK
jgi:multidrug resistance protein, MATE family